MDDAAAAISCHDGAGPRGEIKDAGRVYQRCLVHMVTILTLH